MSFGHAVFDPEQPASLAELIRLGDQAMYEDKRRRRQGRKRAHAGT